MSLTFKQINHSYADQAVLKSVSLTAKRGEILCLLGPSGSGKTTLLRLAAGLEVLQSGQILLDAATLANATTHIPPEQRGVGLVFQDHVLYPHLTVAENVAFGLAAHSRDERQSRVAAQLASVDLADYAERYPHTLSGGQQQRVALARALAPQPAVMLLDEPFASIDTGLRRRLREEARLRLKASNAVTLVVTHDAQEAMELGDQIAYLYKGELAQLGTAEALWREPASIAVAMAFGDAQQFAVQCQQSQLHTPYGVLDPQQSSDARQRFDAPKCEWVIRPDSVRLTQGEAPSVATVEDVRFVGGESLLLLRSLVQPDASLLRMRSPVALASIAGRPVTVGQPVALDFSKQGSFIFDSAR